MTASERTTHNDPPAVEGIVRELLKPENADLKEAVVSLGETKDSNFMFGFTRASWPHGIDPATNAALVALINEQNEKASLDAAQTARFEAIISEFDNGWTGAVYGMIMRRVQAVLRQMANS